ncbi:MAG: hypothetical protein E6I76_18550, partial [Chloroflexi bacterium]
MDGSRRRRPWPRSAASPSPATRGTTRCWCPVAPRSSRHASRWPPRAMTSTSSWPTSVAEPAVAAAPPPTRVLYIAGTGRSGSTLLAAILGEVEG